MTVDTLSLGAAVKGGPRCWPIALAAAAYDIYQFFEDNGITSQGDNWVLPDPNKDPLTVYGSYVSPNCSTAIAANPAGSVDQIWLMIPITSLTRRAIKIGLWFVLPLLMAPSVNSFIKINTFNYSRN